MKLLPIKQKVLTFYALYMSPEGRRLHKENPQRLKYVQTWDLAPFEEVILSEDPFKSRASYLYSFIVWSCNLFGGHEISETEEGYDGGDMAIHACRWCAMSILIPLAESPEGQISKEIFDRLNEEVN